MNRHTIVLTSDKRQERLVSLLEGEKRSYAQENVSNEDIECEKIFVLPIPVTKLDRNPAIKDWLKMELIQTSKKENVNLKVFGGAISSEWSDFFESHHIMYWDFMKLPEVVEGNGWITAEATIAEVLCLSEYSIYGQKILVTGYGCCGEKIARLFSKLGAKVFVAARRSEVRQAAVKDGFEAVSFEELPNVLADVSAVVNTVPARVLTEECVRHMRKETLIVDIASKPGGTDFEAAKAYGITAKLALGLPGIYTTTSSALLLKNAILQYAPLQENVSEDKSWIFQIII